MAKPVTNRFGSPPAATNTCAYMAEDPAVMTTTCTRQSHLRKSRRPHARPTATMTRAETAARTT